MRIGVLLYHHVNELEVVGPYSVLHAAQAILDDPEALEVCSVAKSRNSVQTAAEMTITPSWAFASAPPLSGLIVPGGPGAETASRDRAVRQYLDGLRGQLELIASIGSGALVLGACGYLRDQVVTTQAQLRDKLEDFEVLRVSDERLLTGDSSLWSAASSAAGLELALAIVQRFAGEEVAREVARRLDLAVTQPALF